MVVETRMPKTVLEYHNIGKLCLTFCEDGRLKFKVTVRQVYLYFPLEFGTMGEKERFSHTGFLD